MAQMIESKKQDVKTTIISIRHVFQKIEREHDEENLFKNSNRNSQF